MADAEREPDERQHQRREGNRELLPDHELFVVAGLSAAGSLCNARSQLGNAHLGEPLDGRELRKHRVRIEREQDALLLTTLVLLWLAGHGRVTRHVCELNDDGPLVAVDVKAARLGQINRRPIGCARIGQKDASPRAAGRDLTHVQRAAWEIVEKHARLYVALGTIRHDLELNRLVRLVGVGQGDDDRVGGGRRTHDGNEGDGAKEAEDADAACLHRHQLAIGRQAPQPDENAEQHRHRNRHAEGRGKKREQDPQNDRPLDALRDERFAVTEDRRDHQNEGEHDQPQTQGEDGLANEIAVENPQQGPLGTRYQRAPPYGTGRRRARGA